MKRMLPIILAIITASAAIAADPTLNQPAAPSTTTCPMHPTADAKPVNTICPVSGDKVGSAGKPVHAKYQEKTIAFCCKGCLKKFQKNPDKYGQLALKNQTANEGMP